MYKPGDKFYYTNKRTGEVTQVAITELRYKLSSRVLNKNYLLGSEIDSLIETGELSKDSETLKRAKIAKLEKELGIKLKEV